MRAGIRGKSYSLIIILVLFLALRLISLNSAYLWLDEVDFLANTFGQNHWFTKLDNAPDDSLILTNPHHRLAGTIATSLSIVTNATRALASRIYPAPVNIFLRSQYYASAPSGRFYLPGILLAACPDSEQFIS